MSQQYLRTWFISFIFSSLVLAEWNPKDFLKREHSLIKPFTGKHLLQKIIGLTVICQGSGFGIPNWDFIGSTMVTSNYIRLTTDEKSKQGAIWNKVNFIPANPEIHTFYTLRFHVGRETGRSSCLSKSPAPREIFSGTGLHSGKRFCFGLFNYVAVPYC